MQKNSVVSVNHLFATYDDATILEDISFEVPGGEIFMIVGPSGCGKSTLLNHIIGLQSATAGNVLILGKDIWGKEAHSLLKKIGVAYQSGALFGSMTLLENVRLPLEEWTSLSQEAMNTIALEKLQLVGLAHFAHQLPSTLSGGMQKRAAIARAIVLDPEILFLDEPCSGLDPITSAGIDALILKLSKQSGMTFVIISHELRSISAIADTVVLLHHKKIIAMGTPLALMKSSDPFVKQFFNPVSEMIKDAKK